MRTQHSLSCKRIRLVIAFLLTSVIGMTNALAFDFSAVCNTGQTMYYTIKSYSNRQVALTCPNPPRPWQDVERPTGAIELPTTVIDPSSGITYTVTSIDKNALIGCSGLTGDLVIPNTVQTIGDNAFQGCFGFNGTLTIPNSVLTIGKWVFNGCNFTGDLVIPNSVTTIGSYSFYECSTFNGSLVLGNSLTTIGQYAFENCTGFTGDLILPNSLTSLATGAFRNCSGFTGDLFIPKSLTRILSSTFYGCSGLNGILVIPSTIANIYDYAFQNCSFSTVYSLRTTLPTLVPFVSNTPSQTFAGIGTNTPVYVPYSGVSNYSAGTWGGFTNIKGCNAFTGDSNANWSNGSNWTSNAAPTQDEFAVIFADCEMSIPSTTIDSLSLYKYFTLSIDSDCLLSVTSIIANNGTASNFIINDGGQVLNNSIGVQATVKKDINAYTPDSDGWTFIALPLKDSVEATNIENLLSNNYDLYYYDEPNYYWMNTKEASNQFNHMKAQVGYLYANTQNVSLEFVGELECGNALINIPLVYSEVGTLAGFNLIGNPYAHNVTAYTATNVSDPGCFRMNEAHTNVIVSEISEENPLKPAEGFFVKASGEGASITFNARTLPEKETASSICMEVSREGKTIDRLYIKGQDQALEKFTLNENLTKLYALQDNIEYAIVPRAEQEQAVNFKADKNGTYTLNVSTKNLDTDYLHLIDNLTGADIDLLVEPSYTFEAKKSDYASRFRILYVPTPENNDVNSESFAFINNGNLFIDNSGEAVLQVIDMAGRVIISESFSDNYSKNLNLSHGVYVLRLINGNETKTQKIVME